jgi:chromosome segregation ATPase
MKNRNIPYYVAALMLAAGVSTSFVSCVDTDEPETVTKLRQAAIEKIQADADLQKAYAEVQRAVVTKTNAYAEQVKAEAAYKLAEAEYQKALAAKENATAKTTELTNAITEAGLEEAKKEKAENNRKLALKAKQDADAKAATAAADLKHAIAEALKAYANDGNTTIENAYKDYLDAVENYGKAQDEYVAKTTAEKKDLAALNQEVASKTTALAKAKEAKADVEAIYATDDYKTWEADYKTAKEELAKAETKIKALKEEKEVANADLAKQKTDLKADLDKYNQTTATYVYDEETVPTALADILFEHGDIEGSAKYWDAGNNYVARSVAKYVNGKMKLFYKGDIQVKNEDAANLLNDIAAVLKNTYQYDKTESQIKEEEVSYTNANKAFTDGLKKTIEGDTKSDDPETKAGRLAWYKTKWNEYKADKDDATKKSNYVEAARRLYQGGASIDDDGNMNGVALENFVPSDKEALKEKTKWGTYASYIETRENLKEQSAKNSALRKGVALYNTLVNKAKELSDAKDAEQAKYDDKIASDETLLSLQTKINETQAKVDAAQAEIDKYKAIATAVKRALGSKTYTYTYDGQGNIISKTETKETVDGESVNKPVSENISLETIKADVLAELQKAIDDAQADLDAANEDLKNYNAGNRDSNAAVTRAKAKVDEAKLKMDNAKAYYDNLVKLYADKTE